MKRLVAWSSVIALAALVACGGGGGNGGDSVPFPSATAPGGTAVPTPDLNPLGNGSTATFGWTEVETGTAYYLNGNPPQPFPTATASGTYSTTVTTGQSFDGVTDAIEVQVSPGPNFTPAPYYVQSSQIGSTTALRYLGSAGTAETAPVTCSAPYQSIYETPVAQWDGRTGTGPCTSSGTADGYTYSGTFDADGSYNVSFSNANGYETLVENSDGSGEELKSPNGGTSWYVTVAAPVANATTIAANVYYYSGSTALPSPLPDPLPVPRATTIPNFFVLAGASAASAPSPLHTDTFVNEGSVTTLPASCTVGASIVPSGASLTEIDETNDSYGGIGSLGAGQPAGEVGASELLSVKHFYLANVGEICTLITENAVGFDAGGIATNDAPEYIVISGTETDFITASSLQAAYRATRNMTTTMSHASAMLAINVRARMMNPQRFWNRLAPSINSKRGF